MLEDYGKILNLERCLHEIRRYVHKFSALTDEELQIELEKSIDFTKRELFYTKNYELCDEGSKNCAIKWLDTGLVDESNNVIYMQYTGVNPWKGVFVGTREQILSSIWGGSRTSGSTKYVETKQEKPDNFYGALYSKLLVSNDWSAEKLNSYIVSCIVRLNHLLKQNKDYSRYIVFNTDKQFGLINSGLLDTYGKYILLKVKLFETDGVLQISSNDIRFVNGKVVLIEEGFSKENLNKNIERVSFVENDTTELVFRGEIEDFDLGNWFRLNHCINERRTRFPDEFVNYSDEAIYTDITKAIRIGLELNKFDHTYIKPTYNRKNDTINFIIPYHVGNNFQKKPELGIVVAYMNGFWQLMTILSSDDVEKDIMLFSMYGSASF